MLITDQNFWPCNGVWVPEYVKSIELDGVAIGKTPIPDLDVHVFRRLVSNYDEITGRWFFDFLSAKRNGFIIKLSESY